MDSTSCAHLRPFFQPRSRGKALALVSRYINTLGSKLPAALKPFGISLEVVQTGTISSHRNASPVSPRTKIHGRIGAELE